MSAMKRIGLLLAVGVLLAACKTPQRITPPPVNGAPGPAVQYVPSKWPVLPDWQQLDLTPSWTALLQSCRALKKRPQWQPVCTAAEQVDRNDSNAQRAFFEERLLPYQVLN